MLVITHKAAEVDYAYCQLVRIASMREACARAGLVVITIVGGAWFWCKGVLNPTCLSRDVPCSLIWNHVRGLDACTGDPKLGEAWANGEKRSDVSIQPE